MRRVGFRANSGCPTLLAVFAAIATVIAVHQIYLALPGCPDRADKSL